MIARTLVWAERERERKVAAIKTKARNYFCCPAGEVLRVCVCVLCRYSLDFPSDIVILEAAAACGCHYRRGGRRKDNGSQVLSSGAQDTEAHPERQ